MEGGKSAPPSQILLFVFVTNSRFGSGRFGSRALARKRHGRQIFVRKPFRHEFVQLLRIELRVLRDLIERSFFGNDFLRREILLRSQCAAFDHGVCDLRCEKPDGAQCVIVARNYVIDTFW